VAELDPFTAELLPGGEEGGHAKQAVGILPHLDLAFERLELRLEPREMELEVLRPRDAIAAHLPRHGVARIEGADAVLNRPDRIATQPKRLKLEVARLAERVLPRLQLGRLAFEEQRLQVQVEAEADLIDRLAEDALVGLVEDLLAPEQRGVHQALEEPLARCDEAKLLLDPLSLGFSEVGCVGALGQGSPCLLAPAEALSLQVLHRDLADTVAPVELGLALAHQAVPHHPRDIAVVGSRRGNHHHHDRRQQRRDSPGTRQPHSVHPRTPRKHLSRRITGGYS